ncbi:hypothetical protein J4G66_20865, partial [Aeromonas dhakensis]|nr:hypothetical protein [Aeromonas dhakensis]
NIKASQSGGFFVSAFSIHRYLPGIEIETGLPRSFYLDGSHQSFIALVFPLLLYRGQRRLADAQRLQILVKQACAADLGQSCFHPNQLPFIVAVYQ